MSTGLHEDPSDIPETEEWQQERDPLFSRIKEKPTKMTAETKRDKILRKIAKAQSSLKAMDDLDDTNAILQQAARQRLNEAEEIAATYNQPDSSDA